MSNLFDKMIMLELLAEAWDLAPDMRLGQLIVSICFEEAGTLSALFYLGDNEFEEEILKFRERLNERKDG